MAYYLINKEQYPGRIYAHNWNDMVKTCPQVPGTKKSEVIANACKMANTLEWFKCDIANFTARREDGKVILNQHWYIYKDGITWFFKMDESKKTSHLVEFGGQ